MQDAHTVARNFLLVAQFFSRVATGSESAIRSAKAGSSDNAQRLPHLDSMGHHNDAQAAAGGLHRVRGNRKIGVSGQDELCVPPRESERCESESQLFASESSKFDTRAAYNGFVKAFGIVQAQQMRSPAALRSKERNDGRGVAAHRLYSADRKQFGIQTDHRIAHSDLLGPQNRAGIGLLFLANRRRLRDVFSPQNSCEDLPELLTVTFPSVFSGGLRGRSSHASS